MNIRAQLKLLRTWVMSVIVKQHLVQTGRKDEPIAYFHEYSPDLIACTDEPLGLADYAQVDKLGWV